MSDEPKAPASGLRLDQRDDAQLMKQVKAGSQAAMAELVRRYQQRVRSYCRRWDADQGDDLAQDVFCELWRGRARYREEGRFAVYLYTIVRNRCRNARRTLFRRPTMAPLDEQSLEHKGRDQLAILEEQERQRRLDHAVTKLPTKLREALLLRFAEDMDYRQIGEIVGAKEVTVRSRVHHGLAKLRALIDA